LHSLQARWPGNKLKTDKKAGRDRHASRDVQYGECAIERGRMNMYAVIKTGGKQYKVAAGEKIKVELLDAEVGAEVTIDQVLAIGSGDGLTVGAPLVAGATVSAKVVSHGKHDKVRIFKLRRRKHYKKSQGHRQNYTELEISAVNG
jgi:large subunit ribosomal protein L21